MSNSKHQPLRQRFRSGHQRLLISDLVWVRLAVENLCYEGRFDRTHGREESRDEQTQTLFWTKPRHVPRRLRHTSSFYECEISRGLGSTWSILKRIQTCIYSCIDVCLRYIIHAADIIFIQQIPSIHHRDVLERIKPPLDHQSTSATRERKNYKILHY